MHGDAAALREALEEGAEVGRQHVLDVLVGGRTAARQVAARASLEADVREGERLVDRAEREAAALDALGRAVAQRRLAGGAERQPDVLADHVGEAVGQRLVAGGDRAAAVPGEHLEHVVEERETGRRRAGSRRGPRSSSTETFASRVVRRTT